MIRAEYGCVMNRCLFVTNLSAETQELDLIRAFEVDGRRVVRASVAFDPEGRTSRGYGFVMMRSEGEASAALAARNGMQIDGRAVCVAAAKDRIRLRTANAASSA